ncbi:GMC oxidoreductase [Dichomitus squalens]|uniref:GMC oxidoreductase n=1 Tax=Dichomitus squalens TaxID=114155 RepID=A0A4Q9NLA3_9APHY|nr:GMC oxidoreductase [Dichomitus squalens]TBU56014.1 GMC oxidoreductase [Dichomitus squalens]
MGGLLSSSVGVGDPRLIAVPVPSPPGKQKPWPKYDYIIVGGGTAGCVLASRLSEDPNTTVLLIEAGKNFQDDVPTKIPYLFANIFRTVRDWDTYTSPQQNLDNRETYWPRGKILGGTSATGASIYHRCSSEGKDFDEWVALGAEGWSQADLNPYFLKAENFHPSPKHPRVNPANHGKYGPMQTGFPSETAPINDYVIEACRENGLKSIDDINVGGQLGVAQLMGTIDPHGRRSSTGAAYLTDEVLKRPNLTVSAEIMIERLVFADTTPPGQSPRVIGVELRTAPNAQLYCTGVNREVILCAGTVGTPQLLMLSGVGPEEDLQKLNIPVVKNLPEVGRNVIDHVSSGPIPFRTKPGLTYDFLRGLISGTLEMLRWRFFGTGPYASMQYSSTALVRSTDTALPYYLDGSAGSPVNDHAAGPGAPDLELLWAPQAVFGHGFPKPSSSTDGLTFSAVALKPESRGRITLKSSSIWDTPLIDPNYLSTESDVNVLVRGVRLLLRIAHTDPVASKLDLKPSNIDPSSPWWPGVADPNRITDREIKEMLRRTAVPAWHPVSSARMGKSPDDSVVEPSLRVHGIAGLRCVDASVFPTQVSGHPCAVVVAMAEKAADMIKASEASGA